MKKLSTLMVSKEEDNKYPKGSYQNPYTDSEFEEMMEKGTWPGGFVKDIGYIGPNNNVYGVGNINYEYKSIVYSLSGAFVPDSGAKGSVFDYKVSVNISNGKLYTSALVFCPSGDYEFHAVAEVLVNDVMVKHIRFTIPSSYVYESGWTFVGEADVILKNYHGHVKVRVKIIGNLVYMGIGNNTISSDYIIVYDGKR